MSHPDPEAVTSASVAVAIFAGLLHRQTLPIGKIASPFCPICRPAQQKIVRRSC
jgi:hypothetical protein